MITQSNNMMIQCQQLHYAYAGQTALKDISFEVETGEPVGLVGPNGAGKTTLLSILCGFLPISAGTVTLFGHAPGATALSGRVSALPQDARLDPNFSIGEQLSFFASLQGFGKQQTQHEVLRVLEAVELRDAFKVRPDALSHGMAKRVSIAQALIASPELILLDEPTAGLDPVNTRNIRSIISELSTKTTFIISSHDLTELGRLCQRVLLLEQGEMSSLQLNETNTGDSTRFITLQMGDCPSAEVMKKFKQLAAVVQVSMPQKNEFIIEYSPAIEAKMDLKLISCCYDNQWAYRQLSLGKTLEEKLFFEQ